MPPSAENPMSPHSFGMKSTLLTCHLCSLTYGFLSVSNFFSASSLALCTLVPTNCGSPNSSCSLSSSGFAHLAPSAWNVGFPFAWPKALQVSFWPLLFCEILPGSPKAGLDSFLCTVPESCILTVTALTTLCWNYLGTFLCLPLVLSSRRQGPYL